MLEHTSNRGLAAIDCALQCGKNQKGLKPTGCEEKSADSDRKNTQMVASVYHGITCTELDLDVAGGNEITVVDNKACAFVRRFL